MRRLKEDFYDQRRKIVEKLEENFLKVLDEDVADLDAKDLEQFPGVLTHVERRLDRSRDPSGGRFLARPMGRTAGHRHLAGTWSAEETRSKWMDFSA